MAFGYCGTFWCRSFPAERAIRIVEALDGMGVAYLAKELPDGAVDLMVNSPLPPPCRTMSVVAVVDLLSGAQGDDWTGGGPWVPRLLVDRDQDPGRADPAPQAQADPAP